MWVGAADPAPFIMACGLEIKSGDQIDAAVGGRIREWPALQSVGAVEESRSQNTAGISEVHFIKNVAG